MIEEVRALPSDPAFAGVPQFRVGAAAALRPLPAWKQAADFLFAQVSFSVEALLRWRDANPAEVPVFAGVMVLASEAHALRLASLIPDIDIPAELCERVRSDRLAGVEAACEQVIELRDSGVFDGVHLVPVGRYREVAARLEQLLR
jgi:5,10-methylenetetrahydrofolate reductase